MTAGSPRNPNICLSCEQLLDDDCAELERLMAAIGSAEPAPAPLFPTGPVLADVRETLSGSI